MTASKPLFLAILLGIMIIPSCGELGVNSAKPKAILVSTDGFVGAIFPAGTRIFDDLAGTSWTPTRNEVLDAENQLTPFLLHSAETNKEVNIILKRLRSYKRQYFGISKNGEKELYINLFCSESDDHWRTEEIVVVDGGPCFFNLRFSMKTRTFSDLRINGRA